MLFKKTQLEDKIGIWLVVFVFTLFGAGLRLFHVLRADFPLNDGGLFYTMVHDLLSNQFRLPLYTSYNHLNIPFAYPPLPFYLAAFLQALFGLDGLVVLRFLPLVVSILTIPAFFVFARTALNSIPQALHATLVFAILTPTYQWQIMGGGLTRAPGYLFSILALWQAWLALKTRQVKPVIWTIIFVALSGYCHLEILLSTAIFITVITFFLARSRWGLVFLLAIGIGALALLLPYILMTTSRHGLDSFVSAFQSGDLSPLKSVLRLLFQGVTLEYLFTPFLVIALLAFGKKLQQRDFLLPCLVLFTALFDPRSMERSLAIPLSLLVGIGIDEIVIPGIGGIFQREKPVEGRTRLVLFPSLLAAFLVVYIAIRAAFSSQVYLLMEDQNLAGLPLADQVAMYWIDNNIPAESTFLILSGPSFWWNDGTSEWFPVLAQRTSLATVQGSEWQPPGSFKRQIDFHSALLDCSFKDVACIEALARQNGAHFTHIYLSGQLSDRDTGFLSPLPVERALRGSLGYKLVYDQDGKSVFEKIIR